MLSRAKFFETKKGLRLSLIGAALLISVILLYGIFRLLTLPPLDLKPGAVIEASYHVPGGPYHIGDLIPLELHVASLPNIKYRLPDLAVSGLGKLEPRRDRDVLTEWRRGGRLIRVRYWVTAWNVGEYKLPGFILPYQKNGMKWSCRVKPFTLKIISVLPPGKTPAELLKLPPRGIKGPLELPARYELLLLSFGILAFIAGVILAIRWLRDHFKGRGKETAQTGATLFAPEIREPAHLIALRRLDFLEKADHVTQKAFKLYYGELSEIAREYMENRFHTKALEMTTEEFLSHITGSGLLEISQQSLLRNFLTMADLVKFAKHIPPENEAREDLAHIRRLVTETAVKAEPAPPLEAGNHPVSEN